MAAPPPPTAGRRARHARAGITPPTCLCLPGQLRRQHDVPRPRAAHAEAGAWRSTLPGLAQMHLKTYRNWAHRTRRHMTAVFLNARLAGLRAEQLSSFCAACDGPASGLGLQGLMACSWPPTHLPLQSTSVWLGQYSARACEDVRPANTPLALRAGEGEGATKVSAREPRAPAVPRDGRAPAPRRAKCFARAPG